MQLEFQLPQRPQFLEKIHMQQWSTGAANKIVGRREDGKAFFVLEESTRYPGYWGLLHVDVVAADVRETKWPVHESDVVQFLSGLDNLGDFDFRYGTADDEKMIEALRPQ
jgi:hypothetical protein